VAVAQGSVGATATVDPAATPAPRVLNSLSFDADGYAITRSPDDWTFDNEVEFYPIVQTCRPVDVGFHDLARQKGFCSSQERTVAADIHSLAGNLLVKITSITSTLNGQS
jgi:hypothetical protein